VYSFLGLLYEGVEGDELFLLLLLCIYLYASSRGTHTYSVQLIGLFFPCILTVYFFLHTSSVFILLYSYSVELLGLLNEGVEGDELVRSLNVVYLLSMQLNELLLQLIKIVKRLPIVCVCVCVRARARGYAVERTPFAAHQDSQTPAFCVCVCVSVCVSLSLCTCAGSLSRQG
jgi:hypothetical protein